MTEKQFEKKVIQAFHAKGWNAWHIETSEHPGFPDLLVIKDNMSFLIELKVTDNKGNIHFTKYQRPFYERAIKIDSNCSILIMVYSNQLNKIKIFDYRLLDLYKNDNTVYYYSSIESLISLIDAKAYFDISRRNDAN